MVYESDFYTTRRPYRPSTSSYVTTRSQVDWEKVPFVPRPSLVPDPITAFGRREKTTVKTMRPSILDPVERAKIQPSQRVLLEPIKPYVSARDLTREKVLSAVKRNEQIVEAGYDRAMVPNRDHMDLVLPRLHRTTAPHQHHRQYIPYYEPVITPKVQTMTTYYPHHISSRYVPVPHTRLTTSDYAPHHYVTVRVRPAVYMRELDRIQNRKRAAVGWSATEEFLSSNSNKKWEDDSRRIRADTASILSRIFATVPRAQSVVPYHTLSTYSTDPLIRVRLTSDDYISRLLLPLRGVARDIKNMSWYAEPAKRFTGRGHLACVRYSGAKAFPNRKELNHELSMRDGVTLLSFYVKNRLAAAGLATESATVKLLPWRATRKFQAPALMEDPALELKASKAERLERFNASEAESKIRAPDTDALAERKKKRQEEDQLAEERAIVEELARKKEQAKRNGEQRAAELARQEELAAQAAAERAADMERKAELARLAEEEAELERQAAEDARAAEEARLAEESRLVEAARIAEEERLAEEERRKDEDRLAAEQEELRQKELARLEELERQADEDKEAELARQAAELAEIARQESELAALAKQEAELAELARQEAELAELARQEAELAELDRQEAELAALEAEAKALAESDDAPQESNETDEEQAEPQIEEPETPEAPAEDEYLSDEEHAEADVTDEEE